MASMIDDRGHLLTLPRDLDDWGLALGPPGGAVDGIGPKP